MKENFHFIKQSGVVYVNAIYTHKITTALRIFYDKRAISLWMYDNSLKEIFIVVY